MTQSRTADLSRIEVNPEITLGKPVVRGTRIPVYLIIDWVESGHTPEEIAEGYPSLSVEDVAAAVAYTQAERNRTEVHALP
jgi:uncharacterized protein (DUF433 family)